MKAKATAETADAGPADDEVVGKFNQRLVDAGLLVPMRFLREDPANLRDHPERSIEDIKKSLLRFGQQKPIVIHEDGQSMAGSGTIRAARELGWTHLLAAPSELRDHEATGYAIADNRTAEHASWLYHDLQEAFRLMQEAGTRIDDLGFADYELEPLLQGEWEKPKTGDMPGAPGATGHAHVAFTVEQWMTVQRAIDKAKDGDEHMSNGRALELVCAEFLS